MKNKEFILKQYIKLAHKLGKMPSTKDVRTFICSSDVLYKHYYSIDALKEEAFKQSPSLEELSAPAKLVISDIEQLRYRKHKQEVNKTNKKFVEDVSTLDYIAKFSESVFKGRISAPESKKSNKPIKRVHNLLLSDLHFGADIEKSETGVADYGVTEEARRFAYVIKQAGEYKSKYRAETHLKISIVGDVIENSMHDPRTGAVISEQVCRAIHLLTQGVGYLSAKYPKVTVYCATGNHDRNTARHKTRAIHQKNDSLATIIYFSLKAACSKLDNVEFEIPGTPLSSYLNFGKRIGYTHGDTVFEVGNPGSSLNIRAIEARVDKINAALADKDEYSVIMYGHTHTGHLVHLGNGAVLIGNGSLPPPDPFAVSIGIFESNNGQYIYESTEEYAVGDIRYIQLLKGYDKDSSLDKIIVPWKGFN